MNKNIKPRRFSITDKLIIAAFILSVIIIVIVASFSFHKAKIAVLERSFDQINSVRVIKTNLLKSFFNNCEKDIQLAAISTDFQNIVREINLLKDTISVPIINPTIYQTHNLFINKISKKYNNIYIVGRNKLVYPIKFTNTNTINFTSLWEKTNTDSPLYFKDISKLSPHLTISSKITDSLHKDIGMIVFEILPSAIDSVMLNNDPENGLGISGESYLVGSDYLMRSSSRFQKNSILNTLVKTEAVDSVFANKPGTKVVDDYRGIKVLSSYNKIYRPNLHWAILVEIDYKEVTIPIYKIKSEIIFISIFIFFIILIIMIILSKRITYPIQKLNQAAHEVGMGNLDIEIHNNSNDEIGELTETFNQMIVKLKKQTKELEIEKSKSLRSLFDGQEAERQRLSRELHDSLGQLLIGLKLKYESYLNKSNLNPTNFSELSLLFDKTIEETRRISNNLMPAALAEFGLTTAIRNICNDISDNTDIQIQLQVTGTLKNLNLDVKIYLFRIIQEGLTNIIKHAQAEKVLIELSYVNDTVMISIEDNGVGFDTKANLKKNSNGLNNIKDRVSLLNGTYYITSEENKGTLLKITIPIKQA